MESFIDRVAKTFNGRETGTIEGAIGEARRLEERFSEILKIKATNKENNIKTVEETRQEAIKAINDFKNIYRPEAGYVPSDVFYPNQENPTDNITMVNDLSDSYKPKEENEQNQNTDKNEEIDR